MPRPPTQPQDIILDVWSPLSHKDVVGDSRVGSGLTGGIFNLAPTWVPILERRRLTAYKLLAAYRRNVARVMLNTVHGGIDAEAQRDRREYGDAALLIDRAMAGVLGDSVQIVVDGADTPVPEEPELPEPPEQPPAGAPDVATRIFDIQTAHWEGEADAAVDAWEQQLEQHPQLVARQAALRQWFDDEGVLGKLMEQEEDSVGLGDGVLTLAWSSTAKRPVMTVFDPGFYFPVQDPGPTVEDFPRKVHIAWEEFRPDGDQVTDLRKFVRRLTWELVPIADLETGETARQLPWNPDGEPAEVTCLFSDGSWQINELDGRRVDELDESKATWATNEDGEPALNLDLGLDFLPVIHIPNTPASKTHWGESFIALVAQILDDLAGQDTDIRDAERLASAPTVAVSGATGVAATDVNSRTGEPEWHVEPGAVFKLGPQGSMSVIDLAGSLNVLYAGRDKLQARLSENGRVPPEVLGRVRSGGQISGVTLALSFGPFSQVIDKMRLVRQAKHRLLVKFASRLYQLGKDERFPAGPDMPAHLALGNYLPSDRKAIVDIVVALVTAKALSRQTAVQMLVDEGFDIDDALHELDRIQADDTAGALQIAEATASEQLAADHLGLDLPERPVAPTVPTLKPPDDSGKPGPA